MSPESKEISFSTDMDLIRYVEEQASIALPPGWQFEQQKDRPLSWRILPPGQTVNDFLLYVSSDRAEFMIIHGNTDAGPLRLSHLLLNAKTFDIRGLRWFSLSQVIKEVVSTCEANRWGLT